MGVWGWRAAGSGQAAGRGESAGVEEVALCDVDALRAELEHNLHQPGGDRLFTPGRREEARRFTPQTQPPAAGVAVLRADEALEKTRSSIFSLRTTRSSSLTYLWASQPARQPTSQPRGRAAVLWTGGVRERGGVWAYIWLDATREGIM